MSARARRAAALAVILLVLAACSSGGDDASPDTTAGAGSATTATVADTTTSTTLLGRPLVVEEQGFSTYPDPIDPTSTLGGYGVVVRNPDPTLMATGVRVVTRILDAAGTELLKDSAVLNGVMPGQRMAVGRTLLEPIVDPTRLDVRLEVAAWLPPSAKAGIVVGNIVTEPVEDGGYTTGFDVRSSWPDTESAVDATAIYRGEDGRILGAESTTIDALAPGATVHAVIQLLSAIPELAKTDVYVGRGIEAQTVG